jgi:hypothetical protein
VLHVTLLFDFAIYHPGGTLFKGRVAPSVLDRKKKSILLFSADSPQEPYLWGVRGLFTLIEIWERKKIDIGINNLLDIAHVP